MEIKLKDIYFGRADGLQESEEDNFESLFYTGNQKYNLLCENINKFIISGKKGTGKTILAKYFEKEQNKNGITTKTLTKREFVLTSLIEKGNVHYENYEYNLFIEYIIFSQIAKMIIAEKKKLYKIRNIFSWIKITQKIKYLNLIINRRVSVENFQKKEFQTEDISSCEWSGGQQIGDINYDSKLSFNQGIISKFEKNPYYNFLDRLKDDALYLLKYLPINIIFDDLDEIEEKVDGNEKLVRCLIAFIENASKINIEFRNKNIKNSRVIILIRSDIIKILNNYSANLNKIIADSEIRLNWIKKYNESDIHPLLDLIITKIQNSNKHLMEEDKLQIIKRFFPKTINGVPVMEHMLNMSFGRPRDIINMLNIIKEEFPSNTSFNAESYKATQLEYSTKFADELRNELSTHYDADTINECFSIISRINKKVFSYSDVEKCFESTSISCFNSAKEFLDLAYQYGVVGNTWRNDEDNPKKKYNFSWKYREDGYEKPDYNKLFYLHLALRKSLLG